MAADLHCHTQASDGSSTAEELVQMAKIRGLTAIAVTDHDTFAGVKNAVSCGKRYGVSVVPGAEFSAVDSETGRKAHILCYRCTSPELLEPLCRRTQQARQKAGEAMLEKAMAVYPFPAELALKFAQNSTSLFKQHIMRALVEAGYSSGIYSPVFNELFSSTNGKAYEPITYPEVHDVLELIHRAGGIAVLAHPGEYDSYGLLGRLAASHSLEGVEVWHPRNHPGDDRRLSQFARENGLLMTGGTDFHGLYTKIPHPIGSFTAPDNQLSLLMAKKFVY